MRMMTVLATTAIAVSGVGAAVSATSSPAAEVPAQKQDDSAKIVCKSQPFVGSHMSQRICKPRAEWAAGSEHDRRWLDKNNGKLFNDQLIKGEGGGMHISISTPGSRPQ
jgi:hypothetical protein